jgi:hypothetical protein
LLLKHNKQKSFNIVEGDNYIADRVKIVINKKGEVVIISTSLTVDIIYIRYSFSPIIHIIGV